MLYVRYIDGKKEMRPYEETPNLYRLNVTRSLE